MFHGLMLAVLLSGMGGDAHAVQADRPIVRLVGQQTTITIVSTSAGPRYSAIDAGGKAICSYLSLADLRKQHPELSRQIDFGICASAE